MTDGILLAETQNDPYLNAYDTIIVDEAHERSLNIDFILGLLKTLLKRRKNLKVIITSATIDTERFSAHFNDAPIVEVSGRTYPVELRYRPLDDPALDAPGLHLHQLGPALLDVGDVLLLLGRGHRATAFGPGSGDTCVRLRLIRLQPRANVLAHINIGNIDRDNRKGGVGVQAMCHRTF